MTRRPCFILSFFLTLIFCGNSFGGEEQSALLRLPLVPSGEEIRHRPLTSVLSNLGSRVRGGYVLFAVEVFLRQGKEPNVSLAGKPAGELGTALGEVLCQLPDYDMQVASAHLIEIFPRSARSDRQDLLNLRLATFDVADVSATTIIAHPRRFIPELSARLSPKAPVSRRLESYTGPFSIPGRLITLRLRDVTLREILNRVSKATEQCGHDQGPVGWVYRVNSDDTPGVAKHSWQVLSSLPSDWRDYLNSANRSE